jgi:cob(I)alamin adenosyltransferase
MVYTGDGKGKTTAALGLALRQIGWGRRVLFIQFMKGKTNPTGERIAAKELPLLEIEEYGRDEFVDLRNPHPVDMEYARKALARAEDGMMSGRYQMIVLDEVNVAMSYGLISVSSVKRLIQQRPPSVDLVLTGRNCPQELIEVADLVSEIREVKHHYREGMSARKGMEF